MLLGLKCPAGIPRPGIARALMEEEYSRRNRKTEENISF